MHNVTPNAATAIYKFAVPLVLIFPELLELPQ